MVDIIGSGVRGFLPITEEDSDFTFRVLPARYLAYLSVKRKGNKKISDTDYKKVSVEMKEPTIIFVSINDVTIIPNKKMNLIFC
ncbi:hypothetical protein ABWK26_26420 [Bacillus toyonensis]|uniref:hypothetical protein n=1 Tax=Bacillus toyonensis TaxID=155322 RepID=UPI000BEB951B|nr:hypothetical protein [Bacillus toyonensis]PDY52235.1 hypothetical protein CON61_16215 [Bacillus toyonensis]